jgi:7-cyano-7-deazaguanine synthase
MRPNQDARDGRDEPAPSGAIAVLISGGLDSAILLGELLRDHPAVVPLYVRNGHVWEAVERAHLERFLEAVATPVLQPLRVLDLPVADLYEGHWSLTGRDRPGAESPDAAVELPGRNVLLLAKAMLWCHLHSLGAVALATLKGNPFPDATPNFFAAYAQIVNQGIAGAVHVVYPYARLTKVEVLRRGRGLPLERTFSCIHPVEGRHCGACNKCAERRRAFAGAGWPDQTEYASG